MALTDKLTAIANAIRAKTGESGTMTLAQMPTKIASIPTGITPSGTKSITTNGIHDVTNFEYANVSVLSAWDAILPTPSSITPIPITWKNGFRMNNGVETASSTCAISNEIIDMTSWTASDFVAIVAPQGNVFKETNYNNYGAFFKADMSFNDNLTIANYSTFQKIWLFQRNSSNASNRSYLRLQVGVDNKPTGVYKISF